MDQIALVEKQIEDGQKFLVRLAADGIDVAAAFWMRTAEGGQWYLYIATPVVDRDGIREGYRRVQGIIRRMPPPFWVDPFEVKLLAETDPLARAVIAVRRLYPGNAPVRYAGPELGGVSIEGAYLYPLPAVTPAP